MNSVLKIENLKLALKRGLDAMRNPTATDAQPEAVKLLLPGDLEPIIEFQDDGKIKSSDLSARHWNPETGQIVISFRTVPKIPSSTAVESLARPSRVSTQATRSIPITEPEPPTWDFDQVTSKQVEECCKALEETEKAGMEFVALKRFRDLVLPGYGKNYDWVKSEEQRSRVLARAIELGRIEKGRIPNPHSPQFPTTTIALRRADSYPTASSRFSPVTPRK